MTPADDHAGLVGVLRLPQADADGFQCVRTGQSDRGLPSATFACTSGSKRITFVRT